MQIKVSWKHLEIGQALQEHVSERLDRGVSKYFDNAVSADVVFSKDAHLFRATIFVNEGTDPNVIIRAQAENVDVYAAFEQATERVEKQLRRYKKRLRNHHRSNPTVEGALMQGQKFVISQHPEEEIPEEHNPAIIAQKPNQVECMTVSDAVMRMNLHDLPAYLFINKQTGHVDVVYERKDGNISWINSGIAAKIAS